MIRYSKCPAKIPRRQDSLSGITQSTANITSRSNEVDQIDFALCANRVGGHLRHIGILSGASYAVPAMGATVQLAPTGWDNVEEPHSSLNLPSFTNLCSLFTTCCNTTSLYSRWTVRHQDITTPPSHGHAAAKTENVDYLAD